MTGPRPNLAQLRERANNPPPQPRYLAVGRENDSWRITIYDYELLALLDTAEAAHAYLTARDSSPASEDETYRVLILRGRLDAFDWNTP